MRKDIFREIIDKKLCSGCGACAAVHPEALNMGWNKEGFFHPSRNKDFIGDLRPETLEVCPFQDEGPDEDRISDLYYGNVDGIKKNKYTGYYLKCFTGHCYDEKTRLKRTSGGIIYSVLSFILTEGLVDRVFAVGTNGRNDRLVSFRSFGSPEELKYLAKSSYYPSEMSRAVREILDSDERACFVGLPCQVKGLRRILLKHSGASEKVRYTISLFCGHQKSRYYARYLAMHAEVEPGSVSAVDFRKKRKGHSAADYGFEITRVHAENTVKKSGAVRDVYASSWSNNLFMNPACEYCDDMVGETSDLSVGDAWLDEYVRDFRGTSIMIVRHPELLGIMEECVRKRQIDLEEAGPEDIYRSQAGGFRQKREGLQYRLALVKTRGEKPPVKRVEPSLKHISFLDRLQQRLRIELRKKSNRFFCRYQEIPDLRIFRREFSWLISFSRIIVFLRRVRRKLGVKSYT
jgi:coenzyme F420-reducing hydrogenase beta subunit